MPLQLEGTYPDPEQPGPSANEHGAGRPCPRPAGQQEQAPLSRNLFPNRLSRNCPVDMEKRETVQARVRLSPHAGAMTASDHRGGRRESRDGQTGGDDDAARLSVGSWNPWQNRAGDGAPGLHRVGGGRGPGEQGDLRGRQHGFMDTCSTGAVVSVQSIRDWTSLPSLGHAEHPYSS